jgi:nitrate/TMAO reductase-like tetraheme cytochrome c subunit
MSEPAVVKRKGRVARIWHFLWRPSSLSLATLLIVGFIGGIVFWGGFNWTLELTNTESFCISCHEMRDNVYQELKETIHWSNRSGVRATCPDCHVPHLWIYKIRRKIAASNELFHKIVGTVDTKEKFEAHRGEMAQRVWAAMKDTDSRECRNCHSAESMNPAKQREASKVMMDGLKNGLTCIDCHTGIAHHLPKEPDEEPQKQGEGSTKQ